MPKHPEETTIEVYYQHVTLGSFAKAYKLGFIFILSGIKLMLLAESNVPMFRKVQIEEEK